MDELDIILRRHSIDDIEAFRIRGSSTTGLSQNPKKPGKWFSPESDIDLSIQSRKLAGMVRGGGEVSARNVPGLFSPEKMRLANLPSKLLDDLAGWNKRWISKIDAKDIEPAVSDPDFVIHEITDIVYKPFN
ncbi:MAG: hypothetical protein JW902_08060 [Syntrophaceae bacterium]|nr:hypothetical protein [Syntrophaceae bacterium]